LVTHQSVTSPLNSPANVTGISDKRSTGAWLVLRMPACANTPATPATRPSRNITSTGSLAKLRVAAVTSAMP
jgi:hypothetical protein